ITRVIFGPDSQVLDVGRAQRTYTGQIRRGAIARDRTCPYPASSGPPSRGALHHVRHWVRDTGPTSVDNRILLCWYHPDLVHRQGIGIRRDGPMWAFRRSAGHPLREVPDASGGSRLQRGRPPGSATPPPL